MSYKDNVQEPGTLKKSLCFLAEILSRPQLLLRQNAQYHRHLCDFKPMLRKIKYAIKSLISMEKAKIVALQQAYISLHQICSRGDRSTPLFAGLGADK